MHGDPRFGVELSSCPDSRKKAENVNSNQVITQLARYLVELVAEAWADGDEQLADRFTETTFTLLDGMTVSDRSKPGRP